MGLATSRKRCQLFGFEVSGQFSMIDSYAKINQPRFKALLAEEISFLQKKRPLNKITVLDVGANIGVYSICYALAGSGRVIAFEPFPETFDYLSTNLAKCQLPNIEHHNVGLHSETIKIPIGRPSSYKSLSILTRIRKASDPHQSGCMSIYTTDADAVTASFFKGDDFPAVTELDSVDLIKVDVEGNELKVLKGLQQTINKFKPMLKVEFNQIALEAAGTNKEELLFFLMTLGYSKFMKSGQEIAETSWLPIQVTLDISDSSDLLFIQ